MPYPDDYQSATAPDRWVSPEQQAREDAEGIADDLSDAIEAAEEAATQLRRAAQDGEWTPPARFTAATHAALLARAASLTRDLRRLLDGYMPGEANDK